MPEKKTIRVALRISKTEDGNYVFQYCKDQWQTMPFVWPSEASARKDFALIVGSMVKRGYEVIPVTEEEVKACM